MAGESLSFDILAKASGDGFQKTGRAAADASVKMDLAAASLKLWNDTTAKQGKAAATTEAAMRQHAKAAGLLADAENVLGGRATKTTKLLADQGRELDNTGQKAAVAGSRFSALAGSGGGGVSGMGALIAAGVALAPILATVAVGTVGLGAAAIGVAMPIEKAAKAAGGLQANMAKLNPEQQKVAQGLLALGDQFGGFEKQMQPAVFAIFNQGLSLAGHLLGDIAPVAGATGKALGGVLGQIDAEFQSGTWQQFFGFMARTAGPDVQQLGSLFTSLMGALPPLLEALQPLGSTLLTIGTDAARAAGPVGGLLKTFSDNAAGSAHNFNVGAKAVDNWTVAFTNRWIPGAKTVNRWLGNVQHAAAGSAGGLADSGDAAAVAGPKFFSFSKVVAMLNTDMTKLVGNLLTLQGSELSWKQALQAAQAQLKTNTAGLEGNSKNALANKQAVLASTQAAISFASQELTTGRNIDGASRTVQGQIRWLQGLHDKSRFVQDEIHALRLEEAKLAAQRINQTINVQGLGHWSVSQSLAPGPHHRRAAGGLIPGHGSGDTYPALLTPGEVVVPKGMVKAGAVDHLRGALPGFAGGGIVPSYSGAVAGMPPWIRGNDRATIGLIDQAVVRATAAGITAAQAAAARKAASMSGFGTSGPGGGAPAANAALARRMMTDWGSGANWAAWNYVAMRESGWNQFARNPSSGAYGIPQALPPSKMGPAANPPQSNPAAQISWMVGYMQSRYGGPIGAAAHERAFNWYGNGLHAVVNRPTLIGVGERGRERVDVTPVLPGSRGGGGVTVQLEWAGGNAGDGLLNWIQKNVRIRGGGDVQKAFGRPG